ncbi:DNA-binding response regulator [Virgisporangium aliadipatigenens]|uniref:DNA-binding response regulator n=1 Tax=Virgisporangium aliadipatigenens TaxID=741659 RepID=A0A8J3YTJ1_9ACTN|nr:response regulator transcription factor [Virgisporangium aliadipatigenens]GIJ49493.1 DNA-binding response regulator [Virgisporangium aliadipatigenens]
MIRLLLVEDSRSTRAGLVRLLTGQADIAVLGSVDVEADVPAHAMRLGPHVALFNTALMVSQLLPVVDEMRTRNPVGYPLILSDPDVRGMLPPRRRAREASFLLRGTPTPVLADAIRRVARGERLVDPRLEIAAIGADKVASTRELEILGLAAQGDTVADIARRLYLSLGTVRNHLSSVITKTGARNRLDAIRIVRRDGWLR